MVGNQTENIRTKKKKTVGDVFRELIQDKRPWYKRLITAVLAAFAFSYTLFIFGVYEIYITNATFYSFSFDELWLPALLLGLAVTAVITVFLMLLRGKIFNFFTTLVFAVTLCAYIQCNFLNHSLGALDGTALKWEQMAGPMLKNLLIWVLIFAVPFIILVFNKKFWRKTVCFVSALLILMQTAGLVNLFITEDFQNSSAKGYLSNSTIYEVSPENNVIVFLFDRMGYGTLKTVFNTYPDIKEKLTGFTCYDNTAGSYSRTFPSVTYLLTGVECNYDTPVGEYFRKAWREGNFLRDIKAAGFESKLYTEVSYVIKNTDNVEGLIDNIGQLTPKTDKKGMMKTMLSLSMYRYMPTAMKPFFWCYTGDLGRITSTGDGTFASDIHMTDDPLFFQNLKDKGVTVKDGSKGSFIFYHMRGAHDPYIMEADGSRSNNSNAVKQAAGNFRMLFCYIDQLKKLGIYDDTTIIITADHGITDAMTELDSVRMISLLVKPRGADSNAPLKYDASPLNQDNIRSYVLECLGIDHSGYAPSISEIKEGDDVVRYFHFNACDPSKKHRDVELITYKIDGDVSEFENWSIADRKPIEYPFYDAGRNK